MSQKGRILAAVAGLLVVAVIVGYGVALAQFNQGPGMQPGMQPGMGPGPGMPMGMPMMDPAMGQASVAISSGKVFVAAGGRLFRFDAGTLALEKQSFYARPPQGGGPQPGGPQFVPGGPG